VRVERLLVKVGVRSKLHFVGKQAKHLLVLFNRALLLRQLQTMQGVRLHGGVRVHDGQWGAGLLPERARVAGSKGLRWRAPHSGEGLLAVTVSLLFLSKRHLGHKWGGGR
jgi:hypothetical protein